MSEIVMGVEGADSSDSRLALTNSLYKYSGVLEVEFNSGGDEVRVRYEPYNILARDLEETIGREGFRIKWTRE